MVVTDHYAKDEVKEKMEKLESERDALLKLWEDRRISYEQCMDLMLFYRGTVAIILFTIPKSPYSLALVKNF